VIILPESGLHMIIHCNLVNSCVRGSNRTSNGTQCNSNKLDPKNLSI
jgi:hypothetical protein